MTSVAVPVGPAREVLRTLVDGKKIGESFLSHLDASISAIADPAVTAPLGFRAGAASGGVKEGTARLDVALVVSDAPSVAHAVFTRSRVVAAPVVVSRERVVDGRAQGMVLNSGNANACTGVEGLAYRSAPSTQRA